MRLRRKRYPGCDLPVPHRYCGYRGAKLSLMKLLNSPEFMSLLVNSPEFMAAYLAAMANIAATPGTGIRTWLVDGHGKPFTEHTSHWFGEMCDQAGLPKRTRPSGEVVRFCTPHGVRKRCLTDMAERGCTIHEIMAISGHLTMKEVERYTKMADRARCAASVGAMRKLSHRGSCVTL